MNLALYAFQSAGGIVVLDLVDLFQRVSGQVAAFCNAGKDRQRALAQVFKLCAEQRNGQLIAFERVFHLLQRLHHLQKRGARLRPAFADFCADVGRL